MKTKNLILLAAWLSLASCSSGILKYDRAKEDFKSPEFEKEVKIVEPTEEDGEVAAVPETPAKPAPKTKAPVKAKTKTKTPTKTPVKPAAKTKASVPAVPAGRQPDIEDSEGFNDLRRPPVDPFRVGEKVTHEVSYLGAKAGTLSLSVSPYATVNGRKAYNFFIDIKSSSFFSRVFAVDDQVRTFVDYETLLPGAFKLDIKDSGQVKDAKSYFNFDTLRATYWEHRYTEKGGHEEKKQDWEILPYLQNPFSAIFYMRVFKFTPGKEYSFRVADDEKNVVFKARVLERTTLSTDAGDFKAIKLKAEIVSRGNLAKARDFYMWVSDDDRHFILRIEVKLPVGSLVSEAIEIKEGK